MPPVLAWSERITTRSLLRPTSEATPNSMLAASDSATYRLALPSRFVASAPVTTIARWSGVVLPAVQSASELKLSTENGVPTPQLPLSLWLQAPLAHTSVVQLMLSSAQAAVLFVCTH